MRPGYRSTGQPSTWGQRVRGRRLCTARFLGKSVGEGEVAEGFLLAEGSGPGWGRWITGQAEGDGKGKVCPAEGPVGGKCAG